MRKSGVLAALVAAAFCVLVDAARADGSVYVPCYSQIYQGIKNRPFDLTVTLSVRNPGPSGDVDLMAVEYYDGRGRLLRSHKLDAAPLVPFSAREFLVEQEDASGGVGASFVVRWRGSRAPLVEAVMIGTSGGQGVSFTSRGVEIGK